MLEGHQTAADEKRIVKMLFFCAALLLITMITGFIISGEAEEGMKYQTEENPEESRMYYPYKIVSHSAVIYLAQEDIDLLGEEAYYAGLNMLLEHMENDFSEAREILKDYLKDEIPPVRISTCFSDNSGTAQTWDAYYYNPNVGIRLYKGWDQAATSLLHEYIHYLTLDNFRYRIKGGFWKESIAEYISMLVCSNDMARAVNYGLSDYSAFLKSYGFLDEEGKIDIRKFSYGISALWDADLYLGVKYTPVGGRTMTMTKRTQEHPSMDMLTYKQAACFLEYLVNRFGEERVFTHMTYDNTNFRGLYGQTFEELCNEWKQENLKRCAELGLNLDP